MKKFFYKAVGLLWWGTVKIAPAFLLIYLLGGHIAYRYQQRVSDAQIHAQQLAADRVAAASVMSEVSDLLGDRLNAVQISALWKLRDAKAQFVRPNQYSSELRWYQSSDRLRALTCRYFGEDNARWLGNMMLKLGELLDLLDTERGMSRNAATNPQIVAILPSTGGGRDSVRRYALTQLDSLSNGVFKFNLALATRMQKGEIGDSTSTCGRLVDDSLEVSESAIRRTRLLILEHDTVAAYPRR